MDRRGFLKGMLAAGVGAAIIPYANLMKLGYKKTEAGIYTELYPEETKNHPANKKRVKRLFSKMPTVF